MEHIDDQPTGYFIPKGEALKKYCEEDIEHLPTYKRNFFQKTINTPIGYLTRGKLIVLILGILVVLFLCWSFIVGLYCAIH